jgi:hypothetical protein
MMFTLITPTAIENSVVKTVAKGFKTPENA